MRVLLPGVRIRRRIDTALDTFFDKYQDGDFETALTEICAFYQLPKPRVIWYESLDSRTTMGEVTESGIMRLIHPENFKKRKSHTQGASKREWIWTFLHEMWHYLHWVDDERKADAYAKKFVTGLK